MFVCVIRYTSTANAVISRKFQKERNTCVGTLRAQSHMRVRECGGEFICRKVEPFVVGRDPVVLDDPVVRRGDVRYRVVPLPYRERLDGARADRHNAPRSSQPGVRAASVGHAASAPFDTDTDTDPAPEIRRPVYAPDGRNRHWGRSPDRDYRDHLDGAEETTRRVSRIAQIFRGRWPRNCFDSAGRAVSLPTLFRRTRQVPWSASSLTDSGTFASNDGEQPVCPATAGRTRRMNSGPHSSVGRARPW